MSAAEELESLFDARLALEGEKARVAAAKADDRWVMVRGCCSMYQLHVTFVLRTLRYASPQPGYPIGWRRYSRTCMYAGPMLMKQPAPTSSSGSKAVGGDKRAHQAAS